MTALDERPTTRTGRAPDCGHDRPHHARGQCAMCYLRWWKAGGTGRQVEPAPPRTPEPPDELVVEHLVAGTHMPSANPADRRAAAAVLTGRGLSATEIADRLRCTKRTVVRYRAAARTGTPQ